MALIAQGVSHTYGAGTRFAFQALDAIDLSVAVGELVVVAGSTGSGKSTLLRLLAGLLAPTAGAVTVDDASPTERAARGLVGLVFQNPESQFFAETVLADVQFGPRNLGLGNADELAAAALESVGLAPTEFGPRSPFTLSGGEARRVAVAGVLAMQTRYLLLDEPTAGLDAEGRACVVDTVVAARNAAGVVVVTHDPEEFFGCADRVIALHAGRMVFEGDVHALFERPSAYEDAGLRLPEVARTQLLARAHGASIPEVTLDPEAAAATLLGALEAGA